MTAESFDEKVLGLLDNSPESRKSKTREASANISMLQVKVIHRQCAVILVAVMNLEITRCSNKINIRGRPEIMYSTHYWTKAC